jgi:hypothetical protein
MSDDLYCQEHDLECGEEDYEEMIAPDEMYDDQIANILQCQCGAEFDGLETVCTNCGRRRPYGSIGRPGPMTPRTEALINRARQDEAMLDATRGEINEVVPAAGDDGLDMASDMIVQERLAVGRGELDTKIGLLPREPHYLEGGPPPPKIGDGRRLGVKTHKGVGPKPMVKIKAPHGHKGGRRTRRRRRRRKRGRGRWDTIKHRVFGTPLPTAAEQEEGEIKRMGEKHEITRSEGREIKRLMRKERFDRGQGRGLVEHLPTPPPTAAPRVAAKRYIAKGLRRRKGHAKKSETHKKMDAEEKGRRRKSVATMIKQIEARGKAQMDRKHADAELVGNLSKSFRSTETSVRSHPPDYEGELVNIREPYSSNPLVSKVLEEYKFKADYPPMMSLGDTIKLIFGPWWSVACATPDEKKCFKMLGDDINRLEIKALNLPGDINIRAIQGAKTSARPSWMVKRHVRVQGGLKLYPRYIDAVDQLKKFQRAYINEQRDNLEILANELLLLESFITEAEYQRSSRWIYGDGQEDIAPASARPTSVYYDAQDGIAAAEEEARLEDRDDEANLLSNLWGGRKTRRKKRRRRRRTLKGGYKGPSKRGLNFKATRTYDNGVLNISQKGINWIIDGKTPPKIPWQWYRILKVQLSDNALHIEVDPKQAFEQGQMGGYYIYRLTDQDKAEELLKLIAYASPKTKIEADHPAEPLI